MNAQQPQLLSTLLEQAMDDEISLATLLRRCVVLGAQTKSVLLQEWAHKELNGYEPEDELPRYRLKALPLFRDTISGNYVVTGEQFHRMDIPAQIRDGAPDEIEFRQSVDELLSMVSASEPPNIGLESFPLIASIWSQELRTFQSITRIYYRPTTSTFAAMVGAVRTTMVKMVADLMTNMPMELPSKTEVDSAVIVKIYSGSGDHNEIVVDSNTGIVGAGRNSVQSLHTGVPPGDLVGLFDAMRELIKEVANEDDRADLAGAVDDFQAEIVTPEPDAGRVRSRARILTRIVESFGTAALTVAAGDLTTAGLAAAGLS